MKHPVTHPPYDDIVVLKFGGTSVSSLKCWQVIADQLIRVQESGRLPVVVCSALGGVSDALWELADTHEPRRLRELLKHIRSKHLEFVSSLSLDPSILTATLSRLESLANERKSLHKRASPSLKACLLAQGEYLLTTIGYEFLKHSQPTISLVDAKLWMKTSTPLPDTTSYADEQYFLAATCDYQPAPQLRSACLDGRHHAYITQGFVGSDKRGTTVLFGRGGSDTSAACLAAGFRASSLEIWTDVPGIFTANPKEIPDSRLLQRLSYEEVQELASSGAKVLHPRCIEPVASYGIPLSIRWTEQPDLTISTQIGPFKQSEFRIKAITSKTGIYVFSMESIQMWQQTGFLAQVFALFKQFHLSCDTVSTSETNITVTVNSETQTLNEEILTPLRKQLGRICRLTIYEDCVTISLVGQGIRSILHRLAPMMKVFEDRRVFAVSQAANNLNLSFTVSRSDSSATVKELHDCLFSEATDPHLHTFGATWKQITHPPGSSTAPAKNDLFWWKNYVSQLQKIARSTESSLPAYVYHLPTIETQCRKLLDIKAIHQIHYAIKANHHPAIIQLLESLGIGFDCVSYGEIDHLKQHLRDFHPKKILFTPNFAPVSEYEQAFKDQILVTVDNLDLIRNHPKVFAHQKLILRMDLGTRQGHHEYVRTAGEQSKFGIPVDFWQDARDLIKRHNIHLVGLHAHQGSGIGTPDTWKKVATALIELAETAGGNDAGICMIDVGGGFGVADKCDESSVFCPEELATSLAEVKRSYPGYQILIEPGRFLVAEAGIILTEVHQTKTKNHRHYIGVDAGMHTLIRPALYGAYHHICHLNPKTSGDKIIADIVGPICESGDVLGRERIISPTSPKDLLVVCGAGAYGRVMSSNYNLRGFPAEHVLS